MSKEVVLDQFVPRDYQLPIWNAFYNDNFRRLLVLGPRRMGKDISVFNLIVIPEMVYHIGTYYYIFPTYSQAKKAIWDAITIEGKNMLDYIPPELVLSKNSQELKLKIQNGSILQFVGSDNYNSLRGTNPRGVVFSEYAEQVPQAWGEVIRPILAANDGWAVFISTPKGRNHFYDLYRLAYDSPKWFCYRLTLDDTKHISEEAMEQERKEMSEDKILQEYYCSFDVGADGAYYAKIIQEMRLSHRIGNVPWDPSYKVHTAWDLGINDPTVIIFFQMVGKAINIIDYYEASGHSIDHFARLVLSKPYLYGHHFPPHDIMVREEGMGITRKERYYQLGIDFDEIADIDVDDGIDLVKVTLQKTWIDNEKCKQLINSLENYRQKYDSKKKIYHRVPLHDWASHGSDAMRYLAVSVPRTSDGLSAQDIENMRREALYGDKHDLPGFFSNRYQ